MNLTLECLAVHPTYVEFIKQGGEGLHLDVNNTNYFEKGRWYDVCFLATKHPKETYEDNSPI